MDQYEEIMEELNSGIKQLENLKRIMESDMWNRTKNRYSKKNGSKAMFNRAKLNIRDCFRRINEAFDYRFGYMDYDAAITKHAASIMERLGDQ